MKLNMIKEDKNEMEFELEGENHSFSRLLVHELLKDKNVEIAQYNIPHPLVGHPTFYIKTKKGKPKAAIKDALSSLKKDLKSLKK